MIEKNYKKCRCVCISAGVITKVEGKIRVKKESRRESCIGSDPRLSARHWARLFGAKRVAKSLTESFAKSLAETLGETLGKIFRAKESRQESWRQSQIGSYA